MWRFPWSSERKEPRRIELCMAVNDAFAEYARVFLFSLRKHNPWLRHPLKILHSPQLSPLSTHTKEQIRDFYPNVDFISVDESPYRRFFSVTPPHLHPALIKLEAFNLRDCDSVFFLDCDMLCLGDLAPLFSLDVPFAASPAGKDRQKKERLGNGFHWRAGINSGVMLIGKKHLDGRTYQALIGSPLQPCPTADQDILNRFFRFRRIYCLDHRYNYHAEFFWKGNETDVRILHYAGAKPLQKPDLPRMRPWFAMRDEMLRAEK